MAERDLSRVGLRESSLDEQLGFIEHELKQGNETVAGKAFFGDVTPDQAIDILVNRYERPDNRAAAVAKRTRISRGLWLPETPPWRPPMKAP